MLNGILCIKGTVIEPTIIKSDDYKSYCLVKEARVVGERGYYTLTPQYPGYSISKILPIMD